MCISPGQGCDAEWDGYRRSRSVLSQITQQQATPQSAKRLKKGLISPRHWVRNGLRGSWERAIGIAAGRTRIIAELQERHARDEWRRHLPGSNAPEFPAEALVVSRHRVSNWRLPGRLHSDSRLRFRNAQNGGDTQFQSPAMPSAHRDRGEPSCLEHEIQESTQDRHGTSIRQNPYTMSIRRALRAEVGSTRLRRRPTVPPSSGQLQRACLSD